MAWQFILNDKGLKASFTVDIQTRGSQFYRLNIEASYAHFSHIGGRKLVDLQIRENEATKDYQTHKHYDAYKLLIGHAANFTLAT